MNKPFIILMFCLSYCVVVCYLSAAAQIPTDVAAALFIAVLVLAPVLNDLIVSEGYSLNLSFSNLAGVYGLIYCMFYVTALHLLAFEGVFDTKNILRISLLILFGYYGFRIGIGISGVSEHAVPIPRFTERESQGLLLLCWLGALLVLVGDLYLISHGFFYSHSIVYEQEPTVEASFANGITLPFELPTVMILAFLMSKGSLRGSMRRYVKWTFWNFLIINCVLHMLAGSFRMPLTIVILSIGMHQFATGYRLTLRRTCLMAGAGWVCLFLIHRTYFVAQQHGGKNYGVIDSVSLLFEGIMTVNSATAVTTANISNRTATELTFLSTIIDRVDGGQPFLYGEPILADLLALPPRVIWPSKAVILSTQKLIRKEFGMSVIDSPASPLILYYASGGPVAVFGGLFVFGVFLSRLQRWAFKSTHMLPWLLLIWIVSGIVQLEGDQVGLIVGSIRHCLLAYSILCMILFWIPETHRRVVMQPSKG